MPHPSSRPHLAHLRLWACALLLALIALACGGDGEADDGDAAQGDTPAATDDAVADAPADADPGAGDPVAGISDSDLGQIVVAGDGMTLYAFTNDTDGTSVCTDDCATTWPPLVVEEGFTLAEELDAGVFSTIEREDGTLQLVAGDRPLYRYAPDTAPGDITGQGVGGVWFVVTPDGELIEDVAPTDAASVGSGIDY